MQRRDQVDALVLGALELQRALGCGGRMRGGDGVEADGHRARASLMPPRCCSWSTSATRRRTSARSTATGSSSTGASRPCASRPPTSSAPSLRNLLALRGIGLERPDGLDRLLDRARSCARSGRRWRALPRPRDARRRPGRADRHGDPDRQPARARRRPARQRGRRRTTKLGGPCVVVDFGTAITFDVVSADGEYLGGIIAPGRRDLAGGADLARRRAARRSTSPPPRALIGKGTVEAIRSGVIYGFAAQVDGIVARVRGELGDGRRDDRHRRARAEHIVPYCDDDRRGRRPADADGAAADLVAERGSACGVGASVEGGLPR